MMCLMPEYFDDPETFNPGRFDPENKRQAKNKATYVVVPFMICNTPRAGQVLSSIFLLELENVHP